MNKTTEQYLLRQQAWIDKHQIKQGSELIVFKTAKNRQNGWGTCWVSHMKAPELVTLSGIETSTSSVVCLSTETGYWYYPYFCLKPCMTLEKFNEWASTSGIRNAAGIEKTMDKIWMYAEDRHSHIAELKQGKDWDIDLLITLKPNGFIFHIESYFELENIRFFF